MCFDKFTIRVSYTDLGTYVITGLNTNDSVVAFSGALLVAAMAALVTLGLSLLTRALTPLPLRHRGRSDILTTNPGLGRPTTTANI